MNSRVIWTLWLMARSRVHLSMSEEREIREQWGHTHALTGLWPRASSGTRLWCWHASGQCFQLIPHLKGAERNPSASGRDFLLSLFSLSSAGSDRPILRLPLVLCDPEELALSSRLPGLTVRGCGEGHSDVCSASEEPGPCWAWWVSEMAPSGHCCHTWGWGAGATLVETAA